jgi:hypothetical protein
MSSALLRYFAGWIDKIHGESWPADDGYVSIHRRSRCDFWNTILTAFVDED